MASPLEIKIGLHYWTVATEYSWEDEMHRNSPATRNILGWFVRDGLLEKLPVPTEYGATYKATEALGVWVEALCAVPFPVQQWVIPAAPKAA